MVYRVVFSFWVFVGWWGEWMYWGDDVEGLRVLFIGLSFVFGCLCCEGIVLVLFLFVLLLGMRICLFCGFIDGFLINFWLNYCCLLFWLIMFVIL